MNRYAEIRDGQRLWNVDDAEQDCLERIQAERTFGRSAGIKQEIFLATTIVARTSLLRLRDEESSEKTFKFQPGFPVAE